MSAAEEIPAPRDNASNPSAPDPAKASSTRASASGGSPLARMLNNASRTRSAVGRVLRPGGASSTRPL